MSLGIWEILLIVAIIVLVFGTKKVPTVMADVAKGIKQFKKEMAADDKPKVKDQNGRDSSE